MLNPSLCEKCCMEHFPVFNSKKKSYELNNFRHVFQLKNKSELPIYCMSEQRQEIKLHLGLILADH